MFHQSSRWILAHCSCWGEGYQNVSLYAYLYNYLLLMHFMCFLLMQISGYSADILHFYQNSCFKLTCSEECFLGCHPSFLPSTSTFSPPKKNSFVRLPNDPLKTPEGRGIHQPDQKNAGISNESQRISGSFTRKPPNLLPLGMIFLEIKATNCNRWISGRVQQTQPSKNHCRIWDPNISLNVVVGPCNLVFQPGVPIAEYLADNIKTMMTRKNALVPKKMEIRSTYSEATSDVVVCK